MTIQSPLHTWAGRARRVPWGGREHGGGAEGQAPRAGPASSFCTPESEGPPPLVPRGSCRPAASGQLGGAQSEHSRASSDPRRPACKLKPFLLTQARVGGQCCPLQEALPGSCGAHCPLSSVLQEPGPGGSSGRSQLEAQMEPGGDSSGPRYWSPCANPPSPVSLSLPLSLGPVVSTTDQMGTAAQPRTGLSQPSSVRPGSDDQAD